MSITGKTIGRVGIRAIPDLQKFREDLRKGLQRIESSYELLLDVSVDMSKARLQAQAFKREVEANSVVIDIGVDSAAASAAIAAAARNRKTVVEVEVDRSQVAREVAAKGRDLKLRIGDDATGLRKAVARIDAELAKIKSPEVRVALDEGALARSRQELEATLGSAGDVHLGVDPASLASIRAAIKRIDAELARKREVDIATNLDEASLANTRARLEAWIPKRQSVSLDLDEGSAGSVSAAIKAIKAEMSQLRSTKLDVKLDQTSLAKTLAELQVMQAKLGEVDRKADQVARRRAGVSVPKVSMPDFGSLPGSSRLMVTAFTALSPLILSASAAAAGLAYNVGRAAVGALAMAPAFAAAGTAGLAVAATAWTGVAKAVIESGKEADKGGKLFSSAAEDARSSAIRLAQAQRAVVDASERVPLAHRAVARATEAVGQAQRNVVRALERVPLAHRNVTRALEGVAQAQRSAQRAMERVPQAHRNVERAMDGVSDAEKRLSAAQRESKTAQQAVNAARAEAVRNLQNLNDNLVSAQLNERQAALDLADAHYEYERAVAFKEGPTALAKLKLAVDKAEHAYKLSQGSAKDAAKAQRDAAKKGVEGSDAVTSALRQQKAAQDAVVDAQRAVKDAYLGVSDAQRGVVEASEAVADAQRGVRDSLDGVTDAQRGLRDATDAVGDAQRGARDASDGVADAQRGLRDATQAVTAAQEGFELAQLAQEKQSLRTAAATSEFDKAMAKLGPNALDAANSLIATKAALDDVRKSVQENFFAGFSGSLRNLVDVLLPQLKNGLGEVANAMGGGQNLTMDAFASSMDGGRLEAILSNIADMFDGISDGIGGVVGGMADLTEAGAKHLPALGGWIGDLGNKFGEWAGEFTRTGRFDRFVEDFRVQFEGATSAVGSAFGILDGILTATGSKDYGFAGLAGTLKGIEGVVNGPAFQKGLRTVFDGARDGMKEFEKHGGSMGDSLEKLAPVIGKALGGVGRIVGGLADALLRVVSGAGPGIEKFIDGLADGLDAVFGSADALSPVLGAIASLLGKAAQVLGPLVALVIDSLAPSLERVLTALEPLLSAVGELIEYLAPVLGPALEFIAGIITDTLVMGIEGLIGVINGIKKTVEGVVGFVTAIFSGDWKRAWDSLVKIVDGAWSAIVGGIKLFFSVNALGAIRGGLLGLGGFFRAGWDRIAQGAMTAFGNLGAWLGGLGGRFASAISGGWGALTRWVSGSVANVVKFFTNMPGSISSGIGNVGNLLLGKGRAILDGLWRGINSLWGTVTGFFRDLPSRVSNAVGDMGSLLFGAGRAILNSLWNGMVDVWNQLTGWISGIADWISKNKGPLSYDATLLVRHGQVIMGGLDRGLKDGFQDVEKRVHGMGSAIRDAMTDGASAIPVAMSNALQLQTAAFVPAGPALAGMGRANTGPTYYDHSTIVNPVVEPESVTKRRKADKLGAGVGALVGG